MSGNNVPCINVRERTGVNSTARTERKLDDALGLTSMFAAKCAQCGGLVDFETDDLGRSVERCLVCDHVRLLTIPAPRPEGDDYASRAPKIATRRAPRRFAETTADPHVQLLRDTHAARSEAPEDPRLVDARREFDALEARIKDARKGGRPRGPTLSLGRPPGVRRGPVVILDDDPNDTPSHRPFRPATPIHQPTPTSTPMPTTNDEPRTATDCGHPVASRGPIPKLCADCKSTKSETPPQQKKRKPARTGYKTQASRTSAGGPYAATISQLEAELASLDARREKVSATLEQIRELAEA